MEYKGMAIDAKIIAESFREDGNVILPNKLDMYATAINDLLSRAEAAEAAQETLKNAMAEYKERAEKAEHDMKRIVNQSSYPCEYCTKRKCSSTIRKRKCFDFEWCGNKEE